MAQKFIIEGGRALGGEITVQGSKNTALPLIAASILTYEPLRLENVPEISDVAIMVGIAEKLGARVSWDTDAHVLTLEAKSISSNTPDEALSRKLRGSLLFSGALLGRMRSAAVPYPGGDAIGARPLTTHFRALESLGVTIQEASQKIHLIGAGLAGAEVTLEEQSVTATENTILAAVLAPGKTIVKLSAMEPHVQELVILLKKMGADIRWNNAMQIEINGVKRLSGATHRINPDELEISSFAALAGATRSEITIRSIAEHYLDAVFLQLKKMGVAVERSASSLKIFKPPAHYKNFRIQSGLYPKLVSDHLPPFAVLATQTEGTSLIHDWMYEGRLRYLSELQKMGAHCTILDPHRALITGPTTLTGCDIETFDIRSGMTLIIAALVAEGRSTISHIEHIDRGYERIDERLRGLGARIERVEE